MSHISYSYSFPTSPKLREQYSYMEGLKYQLRLMYYRYEVTFSAYVLTPGEKLVMNSVVLLSLGLVGYTLLSCLPNFIFQTFQRIVLSYAVPNDQISVTMGNMWDMRSSCLFYYDVSIEGLIGSQLIPQTTILRHERAFKHPTKIIYYTCSNILSISPFVGNTRF
ncbi:hypothetical protein EYC84_007950 [Monilinia fructicola]|uniref:Uncharacterized protein n=1 Tax=Monilinia fructicola TaxID=38448 RepID=A0A5M9JI59_MONFR|nr:hypothetical protein EYC84_007950 [Monilinia fructicola]